MDTSDLDEVFICNSLEISFVGFATEKRKLDVNGSSEGGTAIGWARCDITKMIVMSELGNLLDGSSTSGKSGENSANVGSLLH